MRVWFVQNADCPLFSTCQKNPRNGESRFGFAVTHTQVTFTHLMYTLVLTHQFLTLRIWKDKHTMLLWNWWHHCLVRDTPYTWTTFIPPPILFKDLLAKKTTASGTIRTNRKNFPKALSNVKDMARGEAQFLFHGAITAARWHDNKDVYCLSTLLDDSMTTVLRQVQKKKRSISSCPQIIVDYNQHMRGVDLADQAMCYYSVGCKTMKWWRRIFWRIHDQAITNAVVIYKANTSNAQQVKPEKFYRIQLANALTFAAYQLCKQAGRPCQCIR